MGNVYPYYWYEDLPKDKEYSYGELLLCYEWQIKRHKILNRDGRKCSKCDSMHDLDIHHKKYISGSLPWEYNDEDLIALCKDCHRELHGMVAIGKYIPKVTRTWLMDPLYKQYEHLRKKL